MPVVLAIANQKGGCGKTTTSVNLAAGLVLEGHRVLLLDMDPQANASASLGIDIERVPVTIHELLTRSDLSMDYGLYRKGNLHIVASRPQLSQLEHGETPLPATAVSDWIARSAGDYDFVVIDCPPSIGRLTGLAFAAARWIVVPVDVGYFSLIGVKQLLGKLEEARHWNPSVDILGFVITHFDPRNSLSHEVAEKVKGSFPGKLFRSTVHATVRLREAPGHHMTIFEYDPSGRAAACYRSLTNEVIQWVRDRT